MNFINIMNDEIRKKFLTVLLNKFPLSDAVDFFYTVFIDKTNEISKNRTNNEQCVAWQMQETQRGYKYDTIIITNLKKQEADEILQPILNAIKKSKCNQKKESSVKAVMQKSIFNDQYELIISTTHGRPALSTAFCTEFIKTKYKWFYYKHKFIQIIKTIIFVAAEITIITVPLVFISIAILSTLSTNIAALAITIYCIGILAVIRNIVDYVAHQIFNPYEQGVNAAHDVQEIKKEIKKSLEETISTGENLQSSLIYKTSENKDIENILTGSPKHKSALLHHIAEKIINYKTNLLIKLSSKELLTIIKQQNSCTFTGLNEAERRSLLQKLLNAVTDSIIQEQVRIYFENIDNINLSNINIEVQTILISAIHNIDPELLIDETIQTSNDVTTLQNTLCAIITNDQQTVADDNLSKDESTKNKPNNDLSNTNATEINHDQTLTVA